MVFVYPEPRTVTGTIDENEREVLERINALKAAGLDDNNSIQTWLMVRQTAILMAILKEVWRP